MCEYRETILIIDDDDFFREQFHTAFSDLGCQVLSFPDLDAAHTDLSGGFNPSLIFADRWIGNEPIERRLLHDIKQASPNSQVVIYTRIDELTTVEVATILSLGAIRVLDRSEVADSVEKLLMEFRELRELSCALDELTQGRSDLMTALVGTDVGVTMIDSQYICWFANNRQQSLVSNQCTGGLCWCLFHDQPLESGPCWGCGVRDVLKETFTKGTAIHRTILTHLRNNTVRWLSVQTKPIYSSGGRVIAGTEAVSALSEDFVRNMESTERLLTVARGLVHAGFGRVRIYQRQADTDMNELVAAAACKDRYEDREYFESLRHLTLPYAQSPYLMKAIAAKTGILVDKWDLGDAPFAETLGLELPYFLVPIWDENDEHLMGIMDIDFVGWDETHKTAAVRHLAKREALEWIREGYCKEVRRTFVGIRSGAPVVSRDSFARQQAALRARQRIGGAVSLDEAIAALREGFREIGPDCEFVVRRKRGNRLLTEHCLNVPEGLIIRDEIDIRDKDSLSAYVLSTHRRPLWVDDYQSLKQGIGGFSGPTGIADASIRSIARIPLRFEATNYGVLCIESTNLHRWRDEGFIEPLLNVAEHTALVLRDIGIRDDLKEARFKIDQAERHRVEAQVLELRTIANVAEDLPLCVFLKDRDHVFRYVNRHFCEDVARKPEDIIGKTDVPLFGKKLAAVYQMMDDRVIETGNTYEDPEEKHVNEMGEKRLMHVVKKPFRSASGEIDGIVGVYWDVTDASHEFRQVRSWRDGFVKSANAIVYAHNMRGVITFANQAAATFLGYGTDELVGKSIYSLVTPKDRKTVRRAIHSKPKHTTGLPPGHVQEFRVLTKDKRVLTLEVATSICEVGPDEPGILGVAHDVTERNSVRLQLAQELERTKVLRSIASGLGRADEVSTLHRLFMLAVTHGACLGFSRAILFLPTDQAGQFLAARATGAKTLAAARVQWEEANRIPLEEAIERCFRPDVPLRTGDLQSVVGELTIDLNLEKNVADDLYSGETLVKRLHQPSPIQSPQFAAATRSEADKDVEFVLAPLKKEGNLAAILWADCAYLDEPVIRKGALQHFDILRAETTLMAEALSNRVREEETRLAHEFAKGMSYSLHSRVGILEFDLSLLKWALGHGHTEAIEKMAKSIDFFKHASVLATRGLRFEEMGVEDCIHLDLNSVVKNVVEHRQDGNITVKLNTRPLKVWMNVTHAEDIVVELLTNALDFADREEPQITVTTFEDNGFACLDLLDNGSGIHPGVRPNLYKRFFRYPEGRLGMGLSYVKSLVDGYAGEIAEIGKAGQGARFVVKIPL